MQIRTATLADARCLAALNDHVHALHVRAEPTRYRETDLAEVEAAYVELLGRPAWRFMVAWEGARALGYVALREVELQRSAFCEQDAYLIVDQLAVAPAARRGGVGRMLMDAALEHARGRGLSRVELDVRAHNGPAQAFYAALGFEPVQQRMGLSLG